MLQVCLIKVEVKLALQKQDPYRAFPECSCNIQHDSITDRDMVHLLRKNKQGGL